MSFATRTHAILHVITLLFGMIRKKAVAKNEQFDFLKDIFDNVSAGTLNHTFNV